MWSSDDFPGADHVPWQLLIRARYAHEIDAVVASTILRQVSRFASVAVTAKVAEAAQLALADAPRDEAGSDQRVNALTSVLDYDDLCPRWPHWPHPPGPHFEELSDPLVGLVIDGALDLVRSAGSESLNKTFGAMLQEVTR